MNDQSDPQPVGAAERARRSQQAEIIIRNNVILGMGSGFIPSPVVDMVALSAIELRMIGELADLYRFRFPNRLALYKVLISVIATLGPIYISLRYRSALKSIPYVGTTLIAGMMSISSGISVYLVGKLFQRHFESGGRFLSSVSSSELRQYASAQRQAGRRVINDLAG